MTYSPMEIRDYCRLRFDVSVRSEIIKQLESGVTMIMREDGQGNEIEINGICTSYKTAEKYMISMKLTNDERRKLLKQIRKWDLMNDKAVRTTIRAERKLIK